MEQGISIIVLCRYPYAGPVISRKINTVLRTMLCAWPVHNQKCRENPRASLLVEVAAGQTCSLKGVCTCRTLDK